MLRYALVLVPAVALAQSVPITTFAPRILEDGSHTWLMTAQWAPKYFKSMGIDRETWLLDSIRRQMGLTRFCEHGWEITSRQEAFDNLIVEGRCK